MNLQSIPPTRVATTPRQAEGEGVLRMLLLVLAVAMPLATLAYLKIQNMRLGYQMSEIRERIKAEEELRRKLELQRSQFERDEAVQDFARSNGLQPRKQSHLIQRAFTPEDQKMARLRPVNSDELSQ